MYRSMKCMALAAVATTLASGLSLVPAMAADTIKIGMVLPYSGQFAVSTKEIDDGVKLYMKLHGDTVAGKKIIIIRRDTTGIAPDIAGRLSKELVIRDHVDFLAGYALTPNALAGTKVATQAKKPMVILNAATSIITERSPYVARVSFTLPQVTEPLAIWAAKHGIKQAYTLVTDYGPGYDAEKAFIKAFTANGGKIVGSVRVPTKNPDFAAYLLKVKDLHPEAIFVFVPTGEQPTQLMKTMIEQGLISSGIKVLAPGDDTDDAVLQSMGDSVIGVITSGNYSYAHKSPENDAYIKAFAAAYPDLRPNFQSVAGYDGMALIYKAIKDLKGEITAEAAINDMKGTKLDSPRGPIEIDPATRDIIQTIYIRKVEKVGGKLVNVEFDQFPNVKDPGK
jgi:branched-chain amino acid transport system substrate-binding protein